MFILILTLTSLNQPPAIDHVPGFDSLAKCMDAGRIWEIYTQVEQGVVKGHACVLASR